MANHWILRVEFAMIIEVARIEKSFAGFLFVLMKKWAFGTLSEKTQM